MRSALQAFAAVFPAELPDKTMFATIVLVTRFNQPLAVWLGCAAAFLLHVTIATAAGGLLSRLPETPVTVIVTLLFAVGAVFMVREAFSGDDDETDEIAEELESKGAGRSATLAAFTVIGLAELGDLTQLTTASLSARTGNPIGVGVGSLAALLAVSGLAAIFGRQLADRIPVRYLHLVGAAVFAGFAIWSALDLV